MADYVFGTFVLDLWLRGERMRKRDRGGVGGKGRHESRGSKLVFRWTVRDKKTPLTVTATE